MADGTISSKLQLDGEQQYKKALNDAYRSLRVLRSELKAETAELGRNASEQDKARAKMASLQKQIQQQQQIVKTLEKALADSKKEYADNAEVQDKWEEKLNKARAALADMENALGDAKDQIADFNSEMKQASDDSQDAAQAVVSFSDSIKSVGNIVSGIGEGLSGVFTATLGTVQDIVSEMFGLIGMAYASAGQWKDIQAMWGGNLESIEEIFTGMELRGVDPSKVSSSIQKLIANVHSGNEDAQKALKELGITESDFTSHWDLFTTVMDKLSTQYYTGGKQYDLVADLFGEKKGSDVMIILDEWQKAREKYKSDILGGGMNKTSAEIEYLDEIGKDIAEVQRTWQAVQESIGAKLSHVLGIDDQTKNTLELLKDVGLLISGEGDRKEIVVKLTDDLNTWISGIATAVDSLSGELKDIGSALQGSDNSLVSFIGRIISSLGGVLDWLAANSESVVGVLETLLKIATINKISEAVTGKTPFEIGEDLVKLGIDISILKSLGSVFGSGMGSGFGASAAEAFTASETALSFGSAIATAAVSVFTAGLIASVPPIIDLIKNPDKYMDYDLDGGLPDNVGKTSPWNWKPLKDILNPEEEEAPPSTSTGEGIMIPTKRTKDGGKVSGWEVSEAQAEAVEKYWDLIRKDPDHGWAADMNWDEFADAFAGMESLAETLDELIFSFGEANINGEEGWNSENVPEGWYRIINDIDGALKNQKIEVNVYVDGERMTDGVNTRLGSMLASGLFG